MWCRRSRLVRPSPFYLVVVNSSRSPLGCAVMYSLVESSQSKLGYFTAFVRRFPPHSIRWILSNSEAVSCSRVAISPFSFLSFDLSFFFDL
jgi:hypothetical protein